jgi:general nucleoside transport system permease protein
MKKETLYAFLRLLTALVIGLIVSGIFIALGGESPFYAYGQLIKGAFAGTMNIITTLRWMVPYIIVGIAAAMSFRAGLFNMGLEGCVYIGALTAALAGTFITGLPPFLHITVCLALSLFAGMLWLVIPAYLRSRYGVNEIIFTWMLSYIAVLLCQYLVAQFFQDPADLVSAPQQVRTPFIQESAKLPQLISPYQLNTSLYIAIGLAVCYYIFCRLTRAGYEHRMLGLSKEFARYGGVDVKNMQFFSLLASGGIASLAGAMEIMGVHYRYIHEFSRDSMGPNGILVALMGQMSPVGIPLSAFFMGALQNGARAMTRNADVSLDTIRILIAVIVICITAEGLYEILRIKKKQREGD